MPNPYGEGGVRQGNTNQSFKTLARSEAKKEQGRKDAGNVSARKEVDDAFRANFERLKAGRVARRAAGNS